MADSNKKNEPDCSFSAVCLRGEETRGCVSDIFAIVRVVEMFPDCGKAREEVPTKSAGEMVLCWVNKKTAVCV